MSAMIAMSSMINELSTILASLLWWQWMTLGIIAYIIGICICLFILLSHLSKAPFTPYELQLGFGPIQIIALRFIAVFSLSVLWFIPLGFVIIDWLRKRRRPINA